MTSAPARAVELLTTIIDSRIITTLIDTVDHCDGTLWVGNISEENKVAGLFEFIERTAHETEYYELNAKGQAVVELFKMFSQL